jgi:hypothetical protein
VDAAIVVRVCGVVRPVRRHLGLFSKSVVDEIVTEVVVISNLLNENDDVRKASTAFYAYQLRALRTAAVAATTSPQAKAALAGASGDGDVLAFWRAVDNGLIPLTGTERQSFISFKATMCALLAVQASSASSERAFSASKFVLDGPLLARRRQVRACRRHAQLRQSPRHRREVVRRAGEGGR